MAQSSTIGCLILACGNTLRGDDGAGPWLAGWAQEHYAAESRVRVLCRQQWTPELAAEIAAAETVLFLDCSLAAAAGEVQLTDVHPGRDDEPFATHHMGPSQLLRLARALYGEQPSHARTLSVGAGCIEVGETFSSPVADALPNACQVLQDYVDRMLCAAGKICDQPA